jgi:hypothetical protein
MNRLKLKCKIAYSTLLRKHLASINTSNTQPTAESAEPNQSPDSPLSTNGMSSKDFAEFCNIEVLPDDLEEYSPDSPPTATFRSLNDVSNSTTTSSQSLNRYVKLDMSIFTPPSQQEQRPRPRSQSESALETQFTPVVLKSSLHTAPLPSAFTRPSITRRAKTVNAGRFTITKLVEVSSDLPLVKSPESDVCPSPSSRFTIERGIFF